MTRSCPDCKATVLSTSQPNRMGTTPEMQKMYDRFDGDDAAALVQRFEMESMALHKTQREWLVREIGDLDASFKDYQGLDAKATELRREDRFLGRCQHCLDNAYFSDEMQLCERDSECLIRRERETRAAAPGQ